MRESLYKDAVEYNLHSIRGLFMRNSNFKLLFQKYLSVSVLTLMAHSSFAADLLGVACESPPPMHCEAGDCAAKVAASGNATETVSGRQFFLDYPCDLQPDEQVIFILNLHGAGAIGNWQRHYFPAMDYKEKYRLVIATPTADGSASMGSGPGVRMWMPDNDDTYLQNVTNEVIAAVGPQRIKSFWLAGHSQGGMTSRRLVCNDFFGSKVDGMLSLSGGRIGQAPVVPRFGPPLADGSPPPARDRSSAQETLPSCDISHIFAIGEHEIVELPSDSPWAEKYHCEARTTTAVVDVKAGWVSDSGRSGYPVWGMAARPGTAQIYQYPSCDDARVVADVVRIDKGHTEGLEPEVTQRILELIVAAPGGKLQR